MNMTMKHRLQVQFVLISVVALILLQAFIVGFSIYRNYRQMTLTADRLILSIHSSQNSLEVDEAKTSLCGTKAGADMKDGLRINRVHHGRQCVEKPSLGAGGVAFYDGTEEKPADIEAEVFYNAVTKGTPLTVEPEQALVVTQLLEAIYESAKTGKTIYFD